VIDPLTALIAFSIFGGVYAVIYFAVRTHLTHIGRDRVTANKARFKTANEAFGGIKDIKVQGCEYNYLLRFRGPSIRMALHQAKSQTLSQVPRFAVEAIALGGVVLFSLVLIARYGGAETAALGQVLPILGLYALVGYRILPMLQAVYGAVAQLRFGEGALENALRDLKGCEDLPKLARTRPAPLPLRREVALRDLDFSYPAAEGAGLRGVTLDIPAGTTLGVVGSTGAGKSTLVDLILGLLQPAGGTVSVDGTAVTQANVRAWQSNVGYVAQTIFLLDASISENIAFGEVRERIDEKRVIECARRACIHDFVVTELPAGYETVIGERGVRLSGGQRQRLGIARALYHDPALLIFDEATSALDNLTEKAVMAAIDAMAGQKTIIMIAHRLSTVKKCDKIVVLDRGRIVAEGTYEQLMGESRQFRAIAEVG